MSRKNLSRIPSDLEAGLFVPALQIIKLVQYLVPFFLLSGSRFKRQFGAIPWPRPQPQARKRCLGASLLESELTLLSLTRTFSLQIRRESLTPGWISPFLMAGSCFSDNHFRSKSGQKLQYPTPSAIAGWLQRKVGLNCLANIPLIQELLNRASTFNELQVGKCNRSYLYRLLAFKISNRILDFFWGGPDSTNSSIF